MRVTLDRSSLLYQLVYRQRTSCERITSQSKDLVLSSEGRLYSDSGISV